MATQWPRPAAALLALVVGGLSIAQTQPAPPAGSRLAVVASDLHMGPGRDAGTGEWQAVEDFRWGADFAAFLAAVDEAGQGATDLILNGDTFELGGSVSDACRYASPRLGCTEPEALARLDRVLEAHATEMANLGAFARRGDNRVVLVPGDRDAALLWPAVARRAVDAIDAPGRAAVAATGYWTSPDGAVFVEHGHQAPGDPYRLAAWPAPFVTSGGQAHLERSWGQQLVEPLYDANESRYPVLDNFAQDGAGLKLLVAAHPDVLAATDVAALARFFLVRPVWQQFRLDLDGGQVQPPRWDVADIRSMGDAFIEASFLPDDPLRSAIERARQSGLALGVEDYTDDELVAICDSRAAIRRARRRLERSLTQLGRMGPPGPECARTPESRGSAFEYFWRSRDSRFATHIAQLPLARAPRVLVHGHTHLAAAPVAMGRATTAPVLVNAGAWQRTLTPFQADEVMTDRGWSEAELLSRLQPTDLAGCYGVVWIEPYAGDPEPALRFWRADGGWGRLPRDAAGIETACGGRGP